MLQGDRGFDSGFEKNSGVTCEHCGGRSGLELHAKLILRLISFAIMMVACVGLYFIVTEPITAADFIYSGILLVAMAALAMFVEGRVARSQFPLVKRPVE